MNNLLILNITISSILVFGGVACILWIIMLVHWKKNHAPSHLDDYLDFFFDVKHQKKILGILRDFDMVCRSNSLTYFLTSGSALGEYRAGGMLPFDDDIDVAMPLNDAQFIINNFSALFPQYKLKFIGNKSWLHIYLQNDDRIFLDIFPIEVSKDTKRLQYIGKAGHRWPQHNWDNTELELQYRNFNGLNVSCLKNPKPYLDRAFPGHEEEMIITHVHKLDWNNIRFMLSRPKSRVSLTPEVYQALRQATSMVKV